MIDYISHNIISFPEYNTNSGSDVSPNKTAFYSGMNLDRVPKRPSQITLDDFLTPDLK